jgi:glycosyltransferase involved in cell wall biosynthesis
MIRRKICIVATVPYALLVFMKPHIAMLAVKHDVTLIAHGDEKDLNKLIGDHVKFISTNIARDIALWRDLYALFALYRIFKRNRFDALHSLMPKTALLAMLASCLAGVPIRIHTFTGQIWANKKGVARWFFKVLDKVVVSCATRILTDSHSQRQFLISEHIVLPKKISVLGHGSVCGVNILRFKPDQEARLMVRSELNIPTDATVYLFLGRVNPDKGVLDLAHAFNRLVSENSDVYLLMVGPDEGGTEELVRKVLGENIVNLRRVGYTDHPERYMASSDIFCLPSYREGFGSVVIEAAACGLPSVASNIYGLEDAISNGSSGILFTAGDVGELSEALRILANDYNMRKRMGKYAMDRVHMLFTEDVVVAEMSKFYEGVLGDQTHRGGSSERYD